MSLSLLIALLAAGPEGLELEWRAPPLECPDRRFVSLEIARLAGPGLLPETRRVQITVRRAGRRAGFVAELRSKHETHEDLRVLRGDTCVELAEAAAVIVAMSLSQRGRAEPEADSEPQAEPEPRSSSGHRATSAPRSEPRTQLAPPSKAGSEAEPRPEPPPPRARPPPSAGELAATSDELSPSAPAPLGFSLRLDGLAQLGALPGPSPGLGLAAVLRLTEFPLRFELGALVQLPQREVIRVAPEAGGGFFVSSVEARVCALPWSAGRWALGACAGGGLGILDAEGFGVSTPARHLSLVPGLEAELRVHHALGSAWGLVLRLGLGAPLTRPVFTMEPLGEVHRVSPVSVQAALGLEFGFFEPESRN